MRFAYARSQLPIPGGIFSPGRDAEPPAEVSLPPTFQESSHSGRCRSHLLTGSLEMAWPFSFWSGAVGAGKTLLAALFASYGDVSWLAGTPISREGSHPLIAWLFFSGVRWVGEGGIGI